MGESRLTYHIDWVTLAHFLYLGVFSLFILLTIQKELFTQQLLFLVAGLFLMVILSTIPRWFMEWLTGGIGYIVSLGVLSLSYLGPSIRGANRWIFIGTTQIQPSEIIKPLILLVFAQLIIRFPPHKLKNIPIHLVLFLVPFLLVFKQPDLGSSIVYLALWLTMMIVGGLPLGLLLVSIVFGTVTIPFVWQHLLAYQQNRILIFLNPALDPKGAGYNALQAMIAVGSGQLFGRGLGRGTQSHLRFLPEFHTDFIFATLVEELGFFGGFALLAGYASLLWRIIRPFIRREDQDTLTVLYSTGLFAMLLTQVCINSGMNMGLIPITGITLPFVSYGGSSIISLSLAFGILWALTGKKDTQTGKSIAIR